MNEVVAVRNTLTSLEVAEMMEIEHAKLIRKLEGDSKQVGIISVLRNAEIGVSEYFVESTYKTEGNNKSYKCYNITKKGCEMIAHKMTGEKGILFTAKYIERFHAMEDYIKEIHQPQLNHYEQAKAEIDLLGVTAKVLNLNDNSKLLCVTNIYNNHGIPTNILPQYTESKGQLLPATELLKRNSVNISAIKFNKLMLEQGLIAELERPSSKGTKKFKTLVDTYWGENQTCPKIPKETQILYYSDKFKELLHKLNLG